ncbi:MAG: dihydropyrimidinase [Gemmatimonadetes bacterium]|nr:dihydropyrimidinase [Gemmatimonadota bacterium]MXX71567.1 dihydropyrimidinase [Gemmatimonadota bacterium]MYC90582.1 dihydropyrimidinase [Gemmatimonadota bacterium]MYG33877.1 dihydropyrimidinase [Gemmatimonadota bacterium]
MSELLIKGGTIVTADRMGPGDVLVRDGRIAAVGRDAGAGVTGDARVIDASGHWVMPGGIDTHTHLLHPIDRLGITTADDFYTGTVAGACGGVTTIVDFSLQRRGESLLQARDRRLVEIEPDAVIDYSFHTIVTDVRDDVLAEMPVLIDDGFPSFKVYMTYGDKIVNDAGLLRMLEVTGEHGGLVYVHCENDCAVNHLIERHLAAGKTGPAYHAPSRPPVVEAEATHRAVMLAGLAGSPLCIAHVTSSGAARHVADARERGEPVAAETCPQYLVLDDSVYDPDAGFEVAKFVCSPPMRAAEHREVLWDALAEGSIQQVSSDHAPFHYENQKTTGRDNFTRIPNGLPGIETRLPLVFTGGVTGSRLSPQRFVEITATNPARIFGMYPRKGTLEVGADADVIVVDPDAEVEIDAARMHSAVDYNPYQGLRVRGFPTWTLSRGEVIAERGEPASRRGRGRLARRGRIDPAGLP